MSEPVSSPVRSTRETVDLLLRTITEGTRDDLADLYAEDVVISNPFAPDGVPNESRGNAQLRARMKSFQQYLAYDAVKDVTVHETIDPQVAIVEFTLVGTLVPTSERFELPAINVIRVVDGLITESRDHTDGVRVAALFARIQAVGG
ncbi:nuclear transport factor 2 family protein [Catenulispora subtropica]|uniref:SnoaL-like domain-containing protein n=1 Tax=Catenulispora subtropica TaxID=450798 RepID=A0ABN2RTP8_9ACTN